MNNFMSIDFTKRLLFSDTPEGIEVQVWNALNDGFDLSANPYVIGGEFCQWVTERPSVFEYKLIAASHPSIFEDLVKANNILGYELALEPVNWNGLICQWMAKVKVSEVLVERAANVSLAGYRPLQILGNLSFSLNSFRGLS